MPALPRHANPCLVKVFGSVNEWNCHRELPLQTVLVNCPRNRCRLKLSLCIANCHGKLVKPIVLVNCHVVNCQLNVIVIDTMFVMVDLHCRSQLSKKTVMVKWYREVSRRLWQPQWAVPMPVLSLCRMCQYSDKGANVSAPHHGTPLPTNVTLYVRRGRWLAKNCLELSSMAWLYWVQLCLCLTNPCHIIRTCNLYHCKTSPQVRSDASEKTAMWNWKLNLEKICSCRRFLSAKKCLT